MPGFFALVCEFWLVLPAPPRLVKIAPKMGAERAPTFLRADVEVFHIIPPEKNKADFGETAPTSEVEREALQCARLNTASDSA